jgi:hemolysin activation/secretion protein
MSSKRVLWSSRLSGPLLVACAVAPIVLPDAVCAQPAAAAAAQQPAAAQRLAPAQQSATPRFEIDDFRVDGNTVLSEEDIDSALYDYLGPDKTINDVEKARAALEAAFANKGYPTVSAEIPVQRVRDGLVILKVTERTVGRLRVTGARYYDLGEIKAGAPSLAEGKVPHMPSVQKDIVALNQWPDRTIAPALKAGAAPDTVDVDLQVKDQSPLHASIELNNKQSADTTPLRAVATLSYDNLWQRGDSASISYDMAPQRASDTEVLSGSYLFHIPDSQLSLLFSYLHSDSNVATVGSTNVVGKGDTAGVRLLIPLGYAEGFVHSLAVGVDYKRFYEADTFAGATSDVPVTYYPLTATYQGNWSGDTSQTGFVANVVMAPQEFGSSQLEFDNKRFAATGNFIYLRADMTRTQDLPHDIELYGHLTGQVTGNSLVSSEQFSLGGMDTVRGYLESEALGDIGGALQLEVRSPKLPIEPMWPLNEARAFAFYDIGTTSIHNPLPEQIHAYGLSSAGFGLRLQLFDYLYGEVADAFTLSEGPVTKAGTNRVLFRVYGEF